MKTVKHKYRSVENDIIAHGVAVISNERGAQTMTSMRRLLLSEGYATNVVSPSRLRRIAIEHNLEGALVKSPGSTTRCKHIAATIQRIYTECGNIGFRAVAGELIRRGVVKSYSHEAVRRLVMANGVVHGERTDIINDVDRAKILKLYKTSARWTTTAFINAVRADGVNGFHNSTILNVIYSAGFGFGHTTYDNTELGAMIAEITSNGSGWSSTKIRRELAKRGVNVGVNRVLAVARKLNVIAARKRYGDIVLSAADRAWLENTRHFGQAEAKRARVLLELAAGRTIDEAAVASGSSKSFATCLKRVFMALGAVEAVQKPSLMALRRRELVNLAGGE